MALFSSLLELVRFLVSEDAQKIVAQAARALTGTANRVSDAAVFTGTVTRSNRSRLLDLQRNFEGTLDSAGISDRTKANILLCLVELAQNALDHGCRSDRDKVTIGLRLGAATIELSVVQRLALPPAIAALRHRPKTVWRAEFSRITGAGGLTNAYDAASEFRIPDEKSIVAVFENHPRSGIGPYPAASGPITMEDAEDRTLIRLWGQIDFLNADTLESELARVREGDCIIDLESVSLISSAGIRVLVNFRKARPASQMVLRGARPHIARVLKSAFLDKVFAIASSEQADRQARLDR